MKHFRVFLVVIVGLLGCGPLPLEIGEQPVFGHLPPCVSNNDGVISAAEFPLAIGVPARFLIADGPLSIQPQLIEGEPSADLGGRRWDFSNLSFNNEHHTELQAESWGGQWFANEFSSATLIAPLSADDRILGPLRVEGNEVILLGSVSREENPMEGKTLLIYQEPVALYRFPIEEGQQYEVSSQAHNGVLQGIPTALEDTYFFEISARGTLVLPQVVLENTLRVTVRLHRTLLTGSVQQVNYLFIHECLGEVARISSAPSYDLIPMDAVFSTAQEFRRLSL